MRSRGSATCGAREPPGNARCAWLYGKSKFKCPRALCRVGALGALLFAMSTTSARAQDIEPRAYSNAPLGVNFAIAGYAYTRDGLAFDPAVPVTDLHLHTSNAVLGYARVVDFRGQSGKIDVQPFGVEGTFKGTKAPPAS